MTKIAGVVDDSGTANTYVITLATAPTVYAKYQTFKFIAKTANSGASTLNVNGLGAKSLVKDVNVPLATGDILAGQIITAIYDGTNFQIIPDFSTQFASKVNTIDAYKTILKTGFTSFGACATNSGGLYRVYHPTDYLGSFGYTSDSDFIVEVLKIDDNYITMIAYDTRSTRSFIQKKINGTWSEWKEIATSEKQQTIFTNAMLLNGWSNTTDQDWARISVNKIGKVIMIVVYATTGTNTTLPAFNLPGFCNSIWLTDANNSGINIVDHAVYLTKANLGNIVFTYIEV